MYKLYTTLKNIPMTLTYKDSVTYCNIKNYLNMQTDGLSFVANSQA